MTLPIETSTRCNCGTHVELQELPAFARDARWQASCPRCLDPVEDAGERDKIVGVGTTTEEALWDWQVSHDEAWEVEWRPVTTVIELERQVAAEAARQRGWQAGFRLDDEACPIVFGPAGEAETGEKHV